MQIESEESQVGGKGGSGLSISLHPLVIINISDHSTRFQCLNGGKMKRVLGVLLGKLVPRPSMRAGARQCIIKRRILPSEHALRPCPAGRVTKPLWGFSMLHGG